MIGEFSVLNNTNKSVLYYMSKGRSTMSLKCRLVKGSIAILVKDNFVALSFNNFSTMLRHSAALIEQGRHMNQTRKYRHSSRILSNLTQAFFFFHPCSLYQIY